MKRIAHTFVFPSSLGRRLRELRRKAGLSQDGLARKMGRPGRCAGTLVGRLERGDVRYPSLALVADFLRACGASFSDILDILDSYTRQAPVDEQVYSRALAKIEEQLPAKVAKHVAEYDLMIDFPRRRKRATRPIRKPDPLKRLERVRRNAATARLHDLVNQALSREADNNMPVKPTAIMRKAVIDHGHRVLSVLNDSRQARPEEHERLVAEACALAVRQGIPVAVATWMTDVARQVFERLERKGDLDWQPDLSLEDLDRKLLSPRSRRTRTQ